MSFDEIDWVEAAANYVRINVGTQEYLLRRGEYIVVLKDGGVGALLSCLISRASSKLSVPFVCMTEQEKFW